MALIHFLLPWEKVVGGADRMRENRQRQGFTLISPPSGGQLLPREKREATPC